MGQANKNSPSIHRLVETAALDAVLMLLNGSEDLRGQPWLATAATRATDPNDATLCGEARQELLKGCQGLVPGVQHGADDISTGTLLSAPTIPSHA